MPSDGPVVDLALHRRKAARPADVRIIIELYRIGDGRVAWDGWVEEWKAEGEEGLPKSWFRTMLRWAVLQWAKGWRLGLRHRSGRRDG